MRLPLFCSRGFPRRKMSKHAKRVPTRRGDTQTAIDLHALHRRARATRRKARAPRTRTRRAHACPRTRPSLYHRLRRSVRFNRKRTLVTLLLPLKNFAAWRDSRLRADIYTVTRSTIRSWLRYRHNTEYYAGTKTHQVSRRIHVKQKGKKCQCYGKLERRIKRRKNWWRFGIYNINQ